MQYFPIELRLQPSRRLFWLVTAAHLIVALPLLFLPGWSWFMRLMLLSAIVLSYRRSQAALRRPVYTALLLHSDGRLQLCTENQQWVSAALCHVIDQHWALWLDLKLEHTHTALMLCPDAFIQPAHWRVLRVWCQHKQHPLSP